MYGWHLYTLVLPYAKIKESRSPLKVILETFSLVRTQNRSFIISRTYTLRKMRPNSDLKCQSYFKKDIFFNSSNPKNNPNIPRILAQIPVSQCQPLKPKILGQIPRNGIAAYECHAISLCKNSLWLTLWNAAVKSVYLYNVSLVAATYRLPSRSEQARQVRVTGPIRYKAVLCVR